MRRQTWWNEGVKLRTAGARLAASAVVGGGVGLALVPVVGAWVAGIAGWIALAVAFSVWTWLIVGRLDAAGTRRHATVEDTSHAVSRAVLVLASLASLVGVGVLLFAGSRGGGAIPWEAMIGVASVVASWVLVHLLFMLHYAKLYYAGEADAAIDFNAAGEPDYHDFAYLAFTIGMTYQVSDTALPGSEARRAVLRHALLSYLFGAVLLAVMINLVVQLASGIR